MKKKKDLKLFGKIIVVSNCIFVAALLVAYISPYISPEKVWMIAFFGLAYPILLFINILYVLFWLVRRRWIMLLSFITILIGWYPLKEHVQFFRKNRPSDMKNTIKLLSYNVRNFDIYNYKKDWSYHYEKRDSILKFLVKTNADIICLQEIVYVHKGNFATIDTILKLKKEYNISVKFTGSNRNNYFGIVTLSRYPIFNKGELIFDSNGNNTCLFSDIKINKDTFRVYNLHLESIHLEPQDIQFAEEVSKGENFSNKETLKKKSKKIITFLKKAFVKRASQARLVNEHISHSPYPVILCGDFNDTPLSYAYHTISNNLKDAFVESGSGIGKTYITSLPMIKIDFILHDKKIESFDFTVPQIKFSDHYPISCYFRLKGKK